MSLPKIGKGLLDRVVGILQLDKTIEIALLNKYVSLVSSLNWLLDLKSATIDKYSAGYATLITGVDGYVIKVYAFLVGTVGANKFRFAWEKGGTDTPFMANFSLSSAGEGCAMAVSPPAYFFECPDGSSFRIRLNSAGNIQGFVCYWLEKVK